MALRADSNFYESLEVHLKELTDSSRNGIVLDDAILQRVDLNNEGYSKDPNPPGAFFTSPNWAYKSKRTLTQGLAYRLIVNNLATGEVDSATTFIIGNSGTAFQVLEFSNSFALNFPVLRESDNFILHAQVPDKNAQIFEGIIRFHYVNKTGSVQTDDSVDWHFASISRTDEPLDLITNQRSFYYFLKEAIGPAPPNVQRFMDSADVFVWAGSVEMAKYQLINGAQGGITADQIKPLYTNIKGKNVLGLFTTRTRIEIHDVPIGDRSLDSLMSSSITSLLGIRGRSDH
jgi:hypothetical protein